MTKRCPNCWQFSGEDHRCAELPQPRGWAVQRIARSPHQELHVAAFLDSLGERADSAKLMIDPMVWDVVIYYRVQRAAVVGDGVAAGAAEADGTI